MAKKSVKRRYRALENMSDPVTGRLTLRGTVLEAEAGVRWVKMALRAGWMVEVQDAGCRMQDAENEEVGDDADTGRA